MKKHDLILSVSQEALTIEKELLEEKCTELRQVQREVEKLLQENKAHFQAVQEEKERNRIKVRRRRVQSIAL